MSSEPLRVERPVVSFTVRSFDETPIRYDLYDRPSTHGVLVVPGFWRERKHPALEGLARFVGHLGYRVAVCDLRGHGESGDTFGFNFLEHYDVDAVGRDMVARTGVESLVLIGFSYGGAIAVSTAARHKGLPLAGLVLISPVADFASLSPKINPFTIHRHIAFGQALRRPRFEWRFARSPKLRAADDISGVHAPVCLIHVKDDWLVGHGHSQMLFEAANEPKELHIIDVPGNYHADRILRVAGDRVEPIIGGFLARVTGAGNPS